MEKIDDFIPRMDEEMLFWCFHNQNIGSFHQHSSFSESLPVFQVQDMQPNPAFTAGFTVSHHLGKSRKSC